MSSYASVSVLADLHRPIAGANWVLSKVPQRGRAELDIGVVKAADAVELVVSDGVENAMQTVNRR